MSGVEGGACGRNSLPTCCDVPLFLAGRVSFLKAPKHGPATHRYARGRRLAVTLFICTAANNITRITLQERAFVVVFCPLSSVVR